MILNEIFNSSHPYQWVKTTATHMAATFSAGDVNYTVDFKFTQGTSDWWWISFENTSVPEDQKFNKTGTGNELVVFKAVVAIAEEFIKMKRPKTLYFSGDNNEGRGELYKRLISTILKRHNGEYKLEVEPVMDKNMFGKPKSNSTAFMLVRTAR